MTTIDYWANPPTADTPEVTRLKSQQGAVNWRLALAVGLNLLAWAAIIKTI